MGSDKKSTTLAGLPGIPTGLPPDAVRTAKDLFAGAAGGIAQVLSGQPFDIVKVRLQTTTKYPSAFSAAAAIWTKEGPLAFYKGTVAPLIGIGACVSVQFGAFHAGRRWFEAQNAERAAAEATKSRWFFSRGQSKKPDPPGPLSHGQYYAAGAMAGVANSVLSGPIEHVRIRLQTQPHGPAARPYSGPWDCVRKLNAPAPIGGGFLRGVYRGQTVTVLREAQAYGLWFLTFEGLMNADAQWSGIARADTPTWKIGLYGGIAGEVLWLGSYPLDVIKSKMQTDGFGLDRRYRSTRDCVMQTWRAGGARGFWKGIGPTLLRAMPVSACTFVMAEMTLRAMS